LSDRIIAPIAVRALGRSTAEPEPILATTTDALPDTPFSRLGGHEAFARIVDRFYDLMDSDPAYAGVRALHAEDLAPMRRSLALVLAGWAGGPRDWFDANPGRCMMSIHRPIAIDREVARQWAAAMKRAIAEAAPEDSEVAEQMGLVLERMALGMGA
jgi:hemoglobin